MVREPQRRGFAPPAAKRVETCDGRLGRGWEPVTRNVVAQHPVEERGRIRVRDVGAEVDQIESRAIGSYGGLRVLDRDGGDVEPELVEGRGHGVGELLAALAVTLDRHR